MRYKPSIAFDRMSGSAKGVTASSNKGAIFIRTRGHGTKKRTADQSVIKSIFRLLTQSWKNLSAEQIQAWNQAAKTQSGRRVLGQKAKLTGSNLYLRLNFWVVRCGGQPLSLPPTLTGIEQPAVAAAAISDGSFMFRLAVFRRGLMRCGWWLWPLGLRPWARLPVWAAGVLSVSLWYPVLGLLICCRIMLLSLGCLMWGSLRFSLGTSM